MARVTFNGEPGETHTNTTGKIEYQLIVAWQNSCGVCCQYDRAISSSWPIPFHRRCRCKQVAIYPYKESQPFVDFRAKIAELGHAEQSRVIGRSNLALVESGLVGWDDVVTKGRIKDFHQVVAERKLTVKQMVKAGVNPRLARAAYDAVHTPAHRQAAAKQKELVAKLRALGVEREALAKAVAERLAARAGIGPGPSGPQTFGITPTTPKPAPKPAGTKPVPAPVPVMADYLKRSGVKPALADEAALKRAVERQLGVEFTPACQARGTTATVVVDLARLDAALARDEGFHVGPGGTGPSAKPGAYAGFQAFFAKAKQQGTPVEMPRLALDAEGRPSVIDGRHRLAAFLDMGLRSLPVSVPRAAAAAFRRAFGAHIAD